MAFEVASVRPSDPGSYDPVNVDLDVSDYFRYHGGPVRMSGALANYIMFAYKLGDLSQYTLLNAQLPKWAQTQGFLIEARAPGNPTKDQVRLMIRSLLAERFGLRLHTEVRQLPVYVLALDTHAKPGLGLQPHPEDDLCTRLPDTGPPRPQKAAPPPFCGSLWWPVNGLVHLRIMDWTIEQMAPELVRFGVSLGGLDPLPVLERTGLQGRFDFNLEFLKTRNTQSSASTDPDIPGPDFLDALSRQAGLKLVKENGPVVTYQIDDVHPPSGN
jgi:uncharacterized protein (TIGR03435 family)